MSRVFALRFHSDYRCLSSGVCCSSDWDVPVDLPVYRTLTAALQGGRLVAAGVPDGGSDLLIVDAELPDDAAAMVARTTSGHCVFYHRPSGLCGAHRDLGHESIPVTCRHFPRLAVRDARGTFISLTHYCPTAAAMLFRDVAIEIVSDPDAFPPADYEGLIVDDDAWPPLLGPRMLMDLASYGAWERHMVGRCAAECSPESVIATLVRDVESLRDFDPANEGLLARIEALPRDLVTTPVPVTLDRSFDHWASVLDAVPQELKPAPDEDGLEQAYAALVAPEWHAWHPPLRRYLAAKAFANWTAYQGSSIAAIVRGIDAALALVRVEASRQCRDSVCALGEPQLKEAIRSADFILNHLAVGEDLAERWSADVSSQA